MEGKDVKPDLKKPETIFGKDFTLPEVFDRLIQVGIEGFKKEGILNHMAFLIMKDFKVGEYRVAVMPMFASSDEQMAMNAKILKRIVKEIEEASTKTAPDIQLVGVVRGGSARMLTCNVKDVLKPDGSLDNTKFIRPRENPEAKNVLVFDLEEDFIKTTRMYEYVQFEGGEVVVNETPTIENKRPYDVREDINAQFGFVFTKGQSAVN